MKYVISLLLFISILSAGSTDNLHITVSNIESSSGVIAIAVYESEGTFGDTSGVIREIEIPSKKGSVDTLISLPAGEYAVMVLHDENGNRKMDTGLMGMPKEGYGCSNNKMNLIGIPQIDKARFSVTDNSVTKKNIILKN